LTVLHAAEGLKTPLQHPVKMSKTPSVTMTRTHSVETQECSVVIV